MKPKVYLADHESNQEFWTRVLIDQPVDTAQSLDEFWDLIHQPGSDYDSGMQEYQARLQRWRQSVAQELIIISPQNTQ